ncbi:restriction endonuclease, partial [Lactobacillus sp. ESL0233]|uniref:type II restriction endonuclease n=1 Tax=Lactobacillus sp. ESL0233 TaxID=2069354 RepID=UPI000F16D995
SRRSRAGKEFEAILELLLMACNITMDSQGSVGRKEFKDKRLGKMVDIVTPSATHFTIDRYNTVLISAKTTLRERWQEVSEEENRTAAATMYLATLDTHITDDVIRQLDEATIRLVVPKNSKNTLYKNKSMVMSYEDLFSKIISTENNWNNHIYQAEDLKDIEDRFKKQADKHSQKYVKDYYSTQITKY